MVHSDRAKIVFFEGSIAVAMLTEKKQFAADLVKHGAAGILGKPSATAR
jgi:hypothetical protein